MVEEIKPHRMNSVCIISDISDAAISEVEFLLQSNLLVI